MITDAGKRSVGIVRKQEVSKLSLSTGAEIGRKGEYTLRQALNKVYIVKAMGEGCHVKFPKCLFGKRIKVVIVE